MSVEEDPQEITPAERQLARHLALLADGPASPSSLTERVIRTARWQQAIRPPLLAVAHLAASVTDALRVLLTGGRR